MLEQVSDLVFHNFQVGVMVAIYSRTVYVPQTTSSSAVYIPVKC